MISWRARCFQATANFEGRINQHIKANYLASPPLVVAYAIAGTTDIDMTTQPLTLDADGNPVYLKDLWPTTQEVADAVAACVEPSQFKARYENAAEGSQEWQDVKSSTGELFDWQDDSTYIQHPPFFADMTLDVKPISTITGARCLAKLGQSVTTDHISPAGAIAT